jgi:four helix bundle protein
MENNFTRNVSFFKFEELRVYHKAIDYVDWVTTATQPVSGNQDNNSAAIKFNSAAQSIAFYIAEGSARNKTQFIHYLKQAISSSRECVILTTILDKQGILSESMVEFSRNQLVELTKMIGALIGSIQKANRKFHTHNHNQEPEEDVELVDPFNIRKY